MSEEPGKVFGSEPTRREWRRQQVDRIVQLVAGDELGIEHPYILIALLTCRFVRPIDVMLHVFLHPLYPASNDIDRFAFPLGIEPLAQSGTAESAGIESLEWENGGKVTLHLNKTRKHLFHTFVRLI